MLVYSFEFRANYTGQLICFANDAHTLYWNNYGQLKCESNKNELASNE